VDTKNGSEDESFSSNNEKYKVVFNKSDETVSIVDCASVNTDEVNYKKNVSRWSTTKKQMRNDR
jgi:hypothetical protein